MTDLHEVVSGDHFKHDKSCFGQSVFISLLVQRNGILIGKWETQARGESPSFQVALNTSYRTIHMVSLPALLAYILITQQIPATSIFIRGCTELLPMNVCLLHSH